MLVLLQNAFVEILSPSVIAVRDRGLEGNWWWEWSHHDWDYCPSRSFSKELSCPLSEDARRIWSSVIQKSSLTKLWSLSLISDFQFPDLEKYISVINKPLNQWYSFMKDLAQQCLPKIHDAKSQLIDGWREINM